jgi:hypothetical protein
MRAAVAVNAVGTGAGQTTTTCLTGAAAVHA